MWYIIHLNLTQMVILSFILKCIGYSALFLFVVGVIAALWETIKMGARKDSGPLPWWVFWRP